MKCNSCGANVPLGGVKCEFCGSTIVRPESPSRLSIFDQIKRSPEYERRNLPERLAALPKLPGSTKVVAVVFPLGCIGFGVAGAVAVLAGAATLGEPSLALVAVGPLIIAVVSVFMQIQFRKKLREYQQASTLARAAVLIGKRGNGRYFLTAEFEDGSRGEFETFGPDLYGRAAEGDTGVLFTRGPAALDFDRVVGLHPCASPWRRWRTYVNKARALTQRRLPFLRENPHFPQSNEAICPVGDSPESIGETTAGSPTEPPGSRRTGFVKQRASL